MGLDGSPEKLTYQPILQARADYAASLPPFLCREILVPHLRHGKRAVILAEEWQPVDAVLHSDWLLRQAGMRQQVMILWNANNTFAFERINWDRLGKAAIITTVSRYMKHLMHNLGVHPLVVPNGLSADTLQPPAREAVASFKARVRGRTVVSKVARWDPSKRWLFAVDTVSAMKRVGWQPLLIARGGIQPHGVDVLAAASAAGLHVVDRQLPQRGVHGLLQVLQGLDGVDVVNPCSPLDHESRLVLLHSAAAILANSQHEPFGLVGLETMAAGGVACLGYTGEDYAMHQLVSQTESLWAPAEKRGAEITKRQCQALRSLPRPMTALWHAPRLAGPIACSSTGAVQQQKPCIARRRTPQLHGVAR